MELLGVSFCSGTMKQLLRCLDTVNRVSLGTFGDSVLAVFRSFSSNSCNNIMLGTITHSHLL